MFRQCFAMCRMPVPPEKKTKHKQSDKTQNKTNNTNNGKTQKQQNKTKNNKTNTIKKTKTRKQTTTKHNNKRKHNKNNKTHNTKNKNNNQTSGCRSCSRVQACCHSSLARASVEESLRYPFSSGGRVEQTPITIYMLICKRGPIPQPPDR